MPITRTGKLNQRITFNSKQTVKINGVAKTDYIEVATIWAAVWSQGVKDRIENIGNGKANTITFIIRDNQSFPISNDMTISFQGIIYEILDVSSDMIRHEWMTIICEVRKL
jgi:SPP1 family predicted phage head-tail adaptor